jgi:biotin operon repressor
VNRTDRLYALVEALRTVAPRPRTAQQLAARFEVSVRTVERDLGALLEAGVPILTRTGPGGGYALDKAHTLPPVNFTPTRPRRWPSPSPARRGVPARGRAGPGAAQGGRGDGPGRGRGGRAARTTGGRVPPPHRRPSRDRVDDRARPNTSTDTDTTTGDPIGWFEIGTDDPAAARAFYGDLFRWASPTTSPATRWSSPATR